ncbi:Y+L amino acid transporter 2 [Apis mellifera caucasica]|uniref:Y+L amino acid transporter 2 n=1 Tax=Apis mellifera TaxID=7460 RepID=A0A7M7MN47_APIME|nr:Y+L amino acid transporter 2 [Apis mellifera]XP_026298477.1 Y+L amino acid transporter 2 [Apis mellifera]KAG6801463.1 Y+L amino acid transporter 2 [Apis mellifera caucasica]KAG9431121.1 Y+L amino acid transporter 2 [Apis mellifera carnica]|eukprot:XP_026298476.1 Y+L amino acid transporter 2 [Apis mellifera]
MISQIFDESPKETQLITSDDESQNLKKIDKNVNGTNKIQMKKQLGLLEGIAIILGIICGSGIFISPKGVITEVGSVGISLIIWVLCGLLSMIGALCYAELGTCIPRSGGDYAYIYEAFGDLPAFLYLWAANLIFVPTTNAIMGLTFAEYVLQPFFPNCSIPDSSVRLLAAVTICLLTFINCYDVKDTSKMQNVFMFTKVGALLIIIITGLVWVILGHTENFENAFENTITDPGKIAVAFYSGIFSYSGWNYLNFMTEELKNPYVNLPRAIYISLPLITLIYVLANVAYLSVLTPTAMIASRAIAVTYGDQLLGMMAWTIPVMVAISAFGGLSVHIMTSSRMCFVGARNGHFPSMLSHINISRFTPTPALIFLCMLSLIMLCTSDIFVLITYCSIVESFFIMLSVAGVLWLRYKQPNMNRPIKMPLWIPITFVAICAFLVFVPCYQRPYEVGIGALITLSGIPAYFIGVKWKNRPLWFQQFNLKITYTVQKLFLSAIEERDY